MAVVLKARPEPAGKLLFYREHSSTAHHAKAVRQKTRTRNGQGQRLAGCKIRYSKPPKKRSPAIIGKNSAKRPMPIQSLQFLSVDEAESFVPSQSTVAISILSPGRAEARLHGEIDDILRLYFHDAAPNATNPAGTAVFSGEQAYPHYAFD